MKRISEAAFVLVVVAAFTALITWPFVTLLSGTLRDWNDALLQTWTLGWNARQMLADPFRLYQAPIFYPYSNTLAFSDGQVLQSMVGLPIILVTGSAVLAHNLLVLFAFLLNGLALYLLVRAWGGNRAGALIGGLVFAFGFYHLNHFMHLDLLWTQWMPLTLLYLDRALRRGGRRDVFLFALFFFLSALSTFYYAFFTAALSAVYFLVFLGRTRGRLAARIWGALALALAAVALALIPFGLPYLQLARDLGLARRPEELGAFSASLGGYLFSMSRNPALDAFNPILRPPNFESVLGPGVFALLLAAYALVKRAGGARILPLVLIGATGLILSLGFDLRLGDITLPLPYRLLYSYVPGFTALRDLTRWGVLVLLAVAVLAGMGWSEFTRRMASRRPAVSATLGMVMLVGLFLEYNQAPVDLVPGQPFAQPPPPVYTWLAAQPNGVIAEIPAGAPSDQYALDTWYQYYGLIHGKPMVNGHSGFAPPYHQDTFERLSHFPSASSIDLLTALDVRWVIIHTDLYSDWPRAESRLPLFSDRVREVASFGVDRVYEVLPAPIPAPLVELRLPGQMRPGTRGYGYLVLTSPVSAGARGARDGTIVGRVTWHDTRGTVAGVDTRRLAAPLVVDPGGEVVRFDLAAPAAAGDYLVSVQIDGLSASGSRPQLVQLREQIQSQDGPAIQLVDAWVSPRAARSGTTLNALVTWRTWSPPEDAMRARLRVWDAAGRARAELDAPVDPATPWEAGGSYVVPYSITLPRGLPQARYVLSAELLDEEGQPIAIRGPDGAIGEQVKLDRAVYIGAGWAQVAPQPGRPADVIFDNGVQLVGFDLKETDLSVGGLVPLVLYWRAPARLFDDYTPFVQLVDSNGQIAAQTDGRPRGGDYPTNVWNEGEWVRDLHTLVLPPSLSPGEYSLRVGWFNTGTNARVRVLGADGAEREDAELAKIHIAP